ncbi:complement C1q tumor necrosis factor-related protein 1-like [Glandiceps talaboti]
MKMSMLLILAMVSTLMSLNLTTAFLKGQKGQRGYRGESGLPGPVGSVGPKGNTGSPGEKGSMGYRGTPGIPGTKGDIGEKGSDGRNGSQGTRGIQGPRGSTGLKGVKGERGLKGQKGGQNNYLSWPVFSVASSSAQDGQSYYKTLTYDYTYTNIGSDMNIATGVFTCQIPGVYFFTFTTFKPPNKYLAAQIMVNNVGKARIFADNKDWQGMQSQSLSISLNAGNTVWVRIDKRSDYRNDVQLFSNDKRHTTFSGHLVRPLV